MAHRIWYDRPASKWAEGLPIGNGRMGAIVQSKHHEDSLALDEITFWSGKSEGSLAVKGSKEQLATMRDHYFQGDYDGGQKLAEQYLQPPKQNYGTNLGLGTLRITFDGSNGDMGRFQRELRLNEAIASATSSFGNNNITRETFISHEYQVLAYNMISESAQEHGLNAQVSFQGEQINAIVRAEGNEDLQFETQALECMHSNGNCGVKAYGRISIQVTGGNVKSNGTVLRVSAATSVLVLLAVNTDYMQVGTDWKSTVTQRIQNAKPLGYEELRQRHTEQHYSLYNRVVLELGTPSLEPTQQPTNVRRYTFKVSGDIDNELFALYFNYGRYLTISGTRADSPLPLHLQGLWNDREANKMNWSCDYHLDINTQMNYFPLESCNLSDLHMPLTRYIERLALAGRETAANLYGCRGWVTHVFSNAWGFTDPGWETSWGLNVTGGLWIASHLMEHFEFTEDNDYLVRYAYPILEAAAIFFLEYMTKHPDHEFLITGPSVSPENTFFPKSSTGAVSHALSLAPTIDIILIRDLFQFCINVEPIVHSQASFIHRLKEALTLLPPFQIGKHGQLQEWLEDHEEAQPDHRHISHLLALIRSSQISVRETPGLSRAVRVTLDNRRARSDLEDIEFTAVLFAMSYARLNDGDAALVQLSHLIGVLSFDNLLSFSRAGIAGAEADIFVIDGNLGATAAIAELLLRSTRQGEIEVLPALPALWSDGNVTGLRARGTLEVDIRWGNGKLISLTVGAQKDRDVTIRYGELETQLWVESSRQYRLNHVLTVIE